MEQGVCLKGEKSQPFSTAKRLKWDVWNWDVEMILSFKIKVNIFVWGINILF